METTAKMRKIEVGDKRTKYLFVDPELAHKFHRE